MGKFDERNELCKACKNQEVGCSHVVMDDMYVLGDTVVELHNNINSFFASGGRSIQFTDGICIEMNTPRTFIK